MGMTSAEWIDTAAQTFEGAALDQLRHEDDADPMAQFLTAQNILLARVLLVQSTARALKEIA